METKPVLTISKLEPAIGDVLDRMFGIKDYYMEVNPGKLILSGQYKNIGQDILDLEVRESDVWLCSYPRAGSTWTQEMVWLIGHDLDFEGAKLVQQIRCPLVELSSIMRPGQTAWFNESVQGTSVDLVKDLPHPRYIKTHLVWDLLPVEMLHEDGSIRPKVIYVARNPKDVVVSYYNYLTMQSGMKATFEEFCELFLKDRAPYGSVWNHILQFWRKRNDPNILFIKYEEMKRDLPAMIRRTAEFLNKELTDLQVESLSDYLSFQNMKTNPAVNLENIREKIFGKSHCESTDLRFIRKGEIGDWQNYMSDDLARRFDEWAEQHLKGTELSFE